MYVIYIPRLNITYLYIYTFNTFEVVFKTFLYQVTYYIYILNYVMWAICINKINI